MNLIFIRNWKFRCRDSAPTAGIAADLRRAVPIVYGKVIAAVAAKRPKAGAIGIPLNISMVLVTAPTNLKVRIHRTGKKSSIASSAINQKLRD